MKIDKYLWEAPLLSTFSTFPNGLSGAGLLLLRSVLSISAFIPGMFYLSDRLNLTSYRLVIGSVLVISGTAILAGFLTRIFSALIVLIGMAVIISRLEFFNTGLSLNNLPSNCAAIYVIVIALSLALSGPGAFSLDARLFGRREIIIPND